MRKDWTPDEIEMAGKVGGTLMSMQDMAYIISGTDAGVLEIIKTECTLKMGALYQAYIAGFLRSEMEVRLSVLDLAKKGSSPAQTMATDYIKQAKAGNIYG